ncbi:MAG: AMP-dependent synthetase/ligase [Ardenticatenaceae bacterium]
MMISRRTIAHLHYERMTQAPTRPAFFYPQQGEFVPMLNKDVLQAYVEIGLGLWELGVRHGERVAVMSNSRYEWDLSDGGALGIGAAVVSIYPTSTQAQATYILQHSGSKVAILENFSHWQLVQPQLAQLPDLEHVVLIDTNDVPSGNWISLAQVRERGQQLLEKQPNLPAKARDAVQPDDLASLMYTSGTTGLPKGVALKHKMLFNVVEMIKEVNPVEEGDHSVIYLPMSHILQRVSNYSGYYQGIIGYFAPAMTELVSTCQVAEPRGLIGVPRVFEKIHARIMAGLEQAPPTRQKLVKRALEVGKKRSQLVQAKQAVPLTLRLQHALFERLVYSKLRARIFGQKIEYLTSGAAPISVELIEFYDAIGLPIFEGYGLTETCSPITVNYPENRKVGTVGPALPGSQVKIAPDGEILLKGPNVFEGYYNNPEATKAAFTEDGWFKSGDIGQLDENGFLRITDRKKNIIITAAGKNIAPAPIEQKLLQHPLIGQVLVYGDKHKYLVALLTLDPENLAVWAQQQGKTSHNSTHLATDPDLVAEIDTFVQGVNAKLARYQTIKQFRILPEEFTTENGLLTASFKIKRRVVETHYEELLSGMYSPN